MKRQMLSLFLTFLILFSVGGVITIATTKTQSQRTWQSNPVSSDKEKAAGATCGPPFAASIKSDKYHCGSCPNVKRIKPDNLIWFNTAQEACNAGYSPCSVCNPPGCNPVPTSTPVPTPTPKPIIPTAILIQAPAIAHVGDNITINGTLIRQDMKSGIAGAPITLKITMDGDNRITTVSAKTDSTGAVSYSTQVSDPRPYGIQLPVNIHFTFSYDGSGTYLASEGVCTIQIAS
jgi:hypothetical protein